MATIKELSARISELEERISSLDGRVLEISKRTQCQRMVIQFLLSSLSSVVRYEEIFDSLFEGDFMKKFPPGYQEIFDEYRFHAWVGAAEYGKRNLHNAERFQTDNS